jgi:hypothetical protein
MDDINSLNTGIPHPARRYNYWLGGKDNFEADRVSGAQIAQAIPWIPMAARANRAFLSRAVRFLVREAGVRQFLDIGTGIPAPGNTHEVAQSIDPGVRVVYVDNDPLVMSHLRALATSTPEGQTGYIHCDLLDPDGILREIGATLDFGQPVAVLLVAVLHFLTDDDAVHAAVGKLVAAMPPGSYLIISHAASDLVSDVEREALEKLTGPDGGNGPFKLRAGTEIAAFTEGMTLVEPGLVPIQIWQPEPDSPFGPDEQIGMYGVVAQKPS